MTTSISSANDSRPVLLLFAGVGGARFSEVAAPLLDLAQVVVIGYDDALAARPDSVNDVPGLELVSVHSGTDLFDAATDYATRHPVSAALTFSEELIIPTARFTTFLRSPGLSLATAIGLSNKYVQRQIFRAAGLPVPPHFLIQSVYDVPTALDVVELPAILKPVRGAGSFMTFVITTEKELREAIELADARLPESSQFILESLIRAGVGLANEGFAPYASVETAAFDGKYFHYAVSDRFPLYPPVLETGAMLPSGLPAHWQEQLTETAEKALRALGFSYGVAHTELMLTKDGPRLIEVNGRPGGPLADMFHRVSNIDIVQEAAKIALGLVPASDPSFRTYCTFIIPRHRVGATISSVAGFNEVKDLPNVYEVMPLSVSGTTDGFRSLGIAAVFAEAASPEEAAAIWTQVTSTIKVSYNDADSLSIYRRVPRELAADISYRLPV